ncbi:MAG TPA: hypothetical protein VMH78_08980 [Thermoplasmata archaeon]|nr:hypothetical protein [Thermoplasmata archaeon]
MAHGDAGRTRTRTGLNAPLLVSAIAASVLIVLVVVAFSPSRTVAPAQAPPYAIPPGAATPNATRPDPYVLLYQGTTISVPSYSFRDVMFQAGGPVDLSGAVSSDHPVDVYVVDGATFATFESGGPVSGAAWAGPAGELDTIDVALAAGTWYLLLSADDSTTGASVEALTNLEVLPGAAA